MSEGNRNNTNSNSSLSGAYDYLKSGKRHRDDISVGSPIKDNQFKSK